MVRQAHHEGFKRGLILSLSKDEAGRDPHAAIRSAACTRPA